jgi:hypothetical protein
LLDRLEEFLEVNDAVEGPFTGGIIFQKSVVGDWAGVALSQFSSGDGREPSVLVEASTGHNWDVTGGRGYPVRIEISREGGDVLRSDGMTGAVEVWRRPVLSQILKCEEAFGFPVDIEWVVSEGTVWFLQVRPIVGLTTWTQPRRPSTA